MKVRKPTILLTLLFVFIVYSVNLNAKSIYSINTANSTITVSGTSTMHDWEMELEKFNCSVEAEITDNYSLLVHSVVFKGIAESLSSDQSLMVSKAHEALKVKQHKTISFEHRSLREIAIHGGTIEGNVTGNMSIAGNSKAVAVRFEGEIDSDTNVKLSGDFEMNLSDFGIRPPTALLGAIRTGDKVTVRYVLYFDVL